MIHAVTDLRTGERTTYEIHRVGRTSDGRIVSNERLQGFRYERRRHPLMALMGLYFEALRRYA